MASLFDDPLYTQLYRTGQGLLNPESPERRRQMRGSLDAVAGRYARAGLTGSGQELQAMTDAAKNLSFDQTIQAMQAAHLPIQNWMLADAIRRGQRSGDIKLTAEVLAALGVPQAAAREIIAPGIKAGVSGIAGLWNALGSAGQADIATGLIPAADFWVDTPSSIAELVGLIG